MGAIHRFGRFELVEDLRELRLEGREIPMQPRVYDVLLHLVRNRDRVVSKTELLESVWGDEIVSEGSLQRAMSLIRSALRDGGAESVIRTYPRQGYRFCAEPHRDAPEGAVASSTEGAAEVAPELALAHEAFARGDWLRAAETFARFGADTDLGAADLEAWGMALHRAGRLEEAIAPLERAVGAHSQAQERVGAARCALDLALLHFDRMELAIARGWVERATRLLEGLPPCRQHGIAAWLRCRIGAVDQDLQNALKEAEEARNLGIQLGDTDVETLGLAYGGIVTQALGDVRAGLAMQNEAAAVAFSGDVSPHVAGLVYCGVIFGCCNLGDWDAASQWTERFTRFSSDHGFAEFPGLCRLHRSELLVTQGRLDEAERELVAARAQLAAAAPYAEGDAYRLLGDIYLARGDEKEAERAYRRSHELGWEPQPGFALLQVARGRAGAALRSIERAVAHGGWANQQRKGYLLASLAEVALAAGEPTRAREALCELEENPELCSTKFLRASELKARAMVAAADGEIGTAIAGLHDAIRLWAEVGASLCAARARVELADLHASDGDPDACRMELDAAEAAFERAGATGYAARCRERRSRLVDMD